MTVILSEPTAASATEMTPQLLLTKWEKKCRFVLFCFGLMFISFLLLLLQGSNEGQKGFP